MAAHDRAREQPLTDRAGPPMPSFRAVRHITAAKVMPFHDTFKTPPFGDPNRVNEIAIGKNVYVEQIAGFNGDGEIAELAQQLDRRSVVFLDMSEQWLSQTLFLLVTEAKLHRLISIRLEGLALDNAIRASQHHGDRHNIALCVVERVCPSFFPISPIIT
jgi:hypothetical protein